ncbi:MAG: hypothetical protein HYX21_02805 [Candidatus Yanofskybacteria bacterium]|nr:hypothetical protein [Candidatus Yanofskybacteria bacterium]
MRSNKIEEYKKTLKLSEFQRQVLVGTLLGDGCLETQNNGRTYRLKIEHSIAQKDYVVWKYQVFKNFILSEPRIHKRISYGLLRKNYCFSTVSHRSLRFYGQQFYKNGKKTMPKIISKIISPLALAVWFMDDGSIKSKQHKALVIHSQSFNKQDLLKIVEVLDKKYGINSTLRKREDGSGYILYLLSKTVEKFIDLVKENILPSMKYKLGNTIA